MAIRRASSRLWWAGNCTRPVSRCPGRPDRGAHQREFEIVLIGSGWIAQKPARPEVSNKIRLPHLFHLQKHIFLTEPKEAICTQDDYSPCAFPYKMGNKTYNGCLRRPGEEEEGPQCPDRTDLDGTNATWWRKCGSGCPEGEKQSECYCFFSLWNIFINLLQYPTISECVGYESINSWPPPPCIFPFVYEGFNHTGCLKDCDQNGSIRHSHTDLPKDCNSEHGCCPTKLDDDGKPSVWGSCNSACQTSSKWKIIINNYCMICSKSWYMYATHHQSLQLLRSWTMLGNSWYWTKEVLPLSIYIQKS